MRPSAASRATPVAIVGAGPVGLAMALGLARHGVRSVLLERDEGTSEQSKAPVVHTRTLEAFRQWDVAQAFLDAGTLRRSVTLHPAVADTRLPQASLDFTELDAEADRAGLLILEQARTEELLLRAVRDSGWCDVRFGAEAVGLEAEGDGATVTVREHGGEWLLEADYVVGCDGADSFVRDALGLAFEGRTYSLRPMLADVEVDDARDHLEWPRIRNGRGGLTLGVRLRPRKWRIIHLERSKPSLGDEVSADEARSRAAGVLGEGPTEVLWSSRFRIHRRSARTFRVGRVLLAGDAAHVHSPVGGQGMNAGIQDAHNLAWKLAYALEGGDADRLLDSYDTERQAVVVGSVSRFTDLVTRDFVQASSALRALAFRLQRLASHSRRLRRRQLRRAAMLDLGYPGSSVLRPEERSAGARLPNPILRAPDGTSARLHDLVGNAPAIVEVADDARRQVDLPVEQVIRVGAGEYADPEGALRGLLGGSDGWILVRPDTHVAWARTYPDGLAEAARHALGMAVHQRGTERQRG